MKHDVIENHYVNSMLKAYVSSTFKDLRDYRRVAVQTLERLGYNARAMEKYFAMDERPLEMCLADVRQCDLYVGIFAWRYGFIPKDGNPEQRSVTECEFREAVSLGIPCLIFLSDDVPGKWPSDGTNDQQRAKQLREELSGGWAVGFFDSPDKLGLEISIAATRWSSDPDFSRYLSSLISELAELPPLPDHTRNLNITEIIPVRVQLPSEPPNHGDEKQPKTRVFTLPQVVAKERTWLLIGEAGQGKSTALRSLAFEYAKLWMKEPDRSRSTKGKPLIPVYFPLARRNQNLHQQVWSALQTSGFRCSKEQADLWIQNQPFLFLIDRLDEADADAAYEELISLLRFASQSRMVVATRPFAGHSAWTWTEARIEPFTNSDIRSLNGKLLGPEQGAALYAAISSSGLLEVFRRPLFARLLALSSPKLMDQRRFTIGELYRDVLEVRFLASWEHPGQSPMRADFAHKLMMSLAYEMLRTNQYVLSRDSVLTIATKLSNRLRLKMDLLQLETILQNMLSHGLIEDRGGYIQFWHASFRDYFAAVWLDQHSSYSAIVWRSYDTKWHECLLFYFSLLRGKRLVYSLRSIMRGLKITFWPLKIGSFPSVSRRVFFVARCLTQGGEEIATLKRNFIRSLPRNIGYIHLCTEQKRDRTQHPADDINYHAGFCDLVGQFRISEAFDYLKKTDLPFTSLAKGLMYEQSDAIVDRMINYLADEARDEKGRPINNLYEVHQIGDLVVQSLDSRFAKKILIILSTSDIERTSRLLNALSSTLKSRHKSHDSAMRDELADHLTPKLIDFVLRNNSKTLRQNACELLNSLTGPPYKHLPPRAKTAFLEALGDASDEIRHRAVLGLWFDSLSEYPHLTKRLLDDPSHDILLQMLHFFLYGDDKRYIAAALHSMRRIANIGSPLRKQIMLFRGNLKQNHSDSSRHAGCITLLIFSALYHPYHEVRSHSVRALGKFRLAWLVPLLTSILHSNEAWVYTRTEALYALILVLGDEAGSMILEGLEDTISEMRECAVFRCFCGDLPIHLRQIAGPKLFALLTDPSEKINRQAAMTLEEWGYLKKNWHIYRNIKDKEEPPVYLGPPPHENPST